MAPANEGVIRRAVGHVKNRAIAQASGCVTHRMTAASSARATVCATRINEIDVPMVVSALKRSHSVARQQRHNFVVTPVTQPTLGTVTMADLALPLIYVNWVPIAATAVHGKVKVAERLTRV